MHPYEERKTATNDVTAKCEPVQFISGYMISGPCDNCASHTSEKYRNEHQDKNGREEKT